MRNRKYCGGPCHWRHSHQHHPQDENFTHLILKTNSPPISQGCQNIWKRHNSEGGAKLIGLGHLNGKIKHYIPFVPKRKQETLLTRKLLFWIKPLISEKLKNSMLSHCYHLCRKTNQLLHNQWSTIEGRNHTFMLTYIFTWKCCLFYLDHSNQDQFIIDFTSLIFIRNRSTIRWDYFYLWLNMGYIRNPFF